MNKLLFIFIGLLWGASYAEAQSNSALDAEETHLIDSLTARLSQVSGEEKVLTLTYLSANWSWKDPNKSVQYAREGLDFLDKMALSDSLKQRRSVQLQLQLGSNLIHANRYQEALEYGNYLDSLSVNWPEKGWGKASVLQEVARWRGTVYRETGKQDLAIKQYLLSAAYAKKLDNVEMEGHSFMSAAFCYENLQKWDSCFYYYDRCLTVWKEEEELTAKALYNRGESYFSKGDFDASQKDVERSMSISRKLKLPILVRNLLLMADILQKKGNGELALGYLAEADTLSLKYSNLSQRIMVEEVYANTYESMGNYKMALKYFKAMKMLNDSMIMASNNEAVSTLQSQYEASQKDLEIAKLTQKNAVQTMRQWLLVCLLAIGALLGGGIFRWAMRKRKARETQLVAENLALKQRFDRLLSLHLDNKIELTGNPEDDFFASLLNILEQNLANEQFSIDDLPQQLNISRAQLFKKVKDFSGKTPAELLRELRMQKAKHLLVKNELSVSEVAYATGFSNPDSFSRTFKTFFG